MTMSLSAAHAAFAELTGIAEKENGLMLTTDDETPVAVVLDIKHYRSIQGIIELAYSGRWSEIYEDYERRMSGDLDGIEVVDPSKLP